MKKKLLLTLIIVIALVSLFAIGVSAATPDYYIDFKVKLRGGADYINAYTVNAESAGNPKIDFNNPWYSDIDFTQEIDKTQIVGLDFSECTAHGKNSRSTPNRMSSTVLPNCTEVKWFNNGGMENKIGAYGNFKNWTALKSFDFGSATLINDNAFQGSGLETLVIPSTVTKFGNNTFYGCTSLTSVKFEGDASSIGSDMFTGCTSLSSVDLGSLSSIGIRMFSKCPALTSISIPSTVKTISGEAFLSSANLATVTFAEGLTSIGSRAFEGTGLTSAALPATLVTIDEKAFYSITTLASVSFANNSALTTIGGSAFYGCTGLTSITIPNSVTTINGSAFNKVPASNLNVPSSLKTLGGDAYRNSGIETVVLPKTLTSLGNYVFHSSKVKSLTVEDGIDIAFGTGVFQNTKQLETVYLGEGITEIGNDTFAGAGASTGVAINVPDSVKKLCSGAFTSEKITAINISETSNLETINNAFSQSKGITSLYLPTGVKIIGGTFAYCYKLEYIYNFENVIMEFTVNGETKNYIPSYFFQECALKEIKIPKNVTEIASDAFNGSRKLEKVYIPASVTFIGNAAFHDEAYPNVTFFYGGTADELLSLFEEGNKKDYISAKEAVLYTSLDATYGKNAIVYNANECDIFYAKVHNLVFEEGNTCCGVCSRCDLTQMLPEDEQVHKNVWIFNGGKDVSFTVAIVASCECKYCGKVEKTENIGAILTTDGYSVENGGTGVYQQTKINKIELQKYTDITGEEFDYGIFAGIAALDEGNPLANGESGIVPSEKTVFASFANTEYTLLQIKVTGLVDGAKIYCGAYIMVGEDIVYLSDKTEAKFAKMYTATINE